MKISTSRFGTIEIDPSEVVEFPEGLLGFDRFHRYVVLSTDDGSPFRWLQCLDDGDLAFVIIEPISFTLEYDLEIPDSDQEFLGLEKAEDVVLYAIVSIPDNPRDMTANLQGPLVVHAETRKGRQIISPNQKHLVKTRIIDEMARRESKLQELQDSDAPESKGEQG